MIAYCVGASIVLLLAWVYMMHRAEQRLQRSFGEEKLASEALPVLRAYRIVLCDRQITEATINNERSFTESLDFVQALEAVVAHLQAVHHVPLDHISYWLARAAQGARTPGGGHRDIAAEISRLTPALPPRGAELRILVRGVGPSVEAVTVEGSLLDHPVGTCLAVEWLAQERFSRHFGESALAIEGLLDALAIGASAGKLRDASFFTPFTKGMIRDRSLRSLVGP